MTGSEERDLRVWKLLHHRYSDAVQPAHRKRAQGFIHFLPDGVL